VQEINTTEGASDNRIDRATSTLDLDLGIPTNVRENITLAELNESQLAVVAVGKEILKTVQPSSHKAKSLVLVRLSLRVFVSAAELNGTAKELLDMLSRSHDACTFIRNVVLHASLGINRQLSFFIDGSS
jgi:hypothetical protein